MAKINTLKSKYLNPAEYVILRFGGVIAVSRIVGISKSSVSKWKHYKGVPRKHHIAILEHAKTKGIRISANNLVHGITLTK